jgi:PAS domain S-box-containing protein
LKYAAAGLAVSLAWGVRWMLDPVLGTRGPYLPFALAVIVAARFGGRKPAIAATAASALVVEYFFLEPRYSLALTDPTEAGSLALFVVVGVLIAMLVGHLRESLVSTALAEESLAVRAKLIDLSHDAVITADAGRIITEWNSGAAGMYGWTAPEAVGKPIHELLQTRGDVPMAEVERILESDGSWSGELIHRARDGREVIAECRLVLLRGELGASVAMLQTDRDITDRKRAAEQLEATHRKTIAILESISDGFNTFDREWRYTYVNPPAAKMLGKTPAELLGKVFWELWPHAADSPFGAAFRRAVAENTPVQAQAFYPKPLNRWFEVRCYPSAEGLTLFFTDTTERRQAEERLRQAQKLESIGLLAGGVAHDFNNLLTVIMGSASNALEERPSCEHSQAILSAAERAAYLTRQLLAYAGKGIIIPRLVDLSELVGHSKELLAASIPKRVDLRFSLAKNLPCLEVDPSQIEQILMNLVVNAGEAILPKTDGTIEVATRACEVTPELARLQSRAYDVAAGQYVCLEVQDNGDGMEEAVVARIFDPFFTTKFTGRGLGLAALQGIVRTAKGFVEVRSSPGSGTTFRIFLPASEKELPPERPADMAPQRTRGASTILVVDDEEMVRKLACMTLRRHGYEVLEARDGKDALRVLAASSSLPALALLDLAMPVMGGDELLPILEAKYPGVKIILSSGYPEEEARKTSAGSIAGFLQKPYTGATLAEKIAKVLQTP